MTDPYRAPQHSDMTYSPSRPRLAIMLVTALLATAAACTSTQDLGNNPRPTNEDAGDASPYATSMRTFATSSAYSGNIVRFAKQKRLSGPEAADWLCADAAKNANLGGNWRAWLSDDSADAADRVQNDGPWVSVDRAYLTFETIADIGSGANGSGRKVLLENGRPAEGAVSGFVDEWGNPTSATLDNTIYTGSTASGRNSRANCDNWTSEQPFEPDGSFQYLNSSVGGAEQGCSVPRSLLCLEQRQPVVAPHRGRVFVTSSGYDGNLEAKMGVAGGIEAANAACSDSAQKAGLSGNFHAWISGDRADGSMQIAPDHMAESSFDGWSDVRETRVLFSSKQALAKPPQHLFLSNEKGEGIFSTESTVSVWTGTTPLGTASPDNCSGWSTDKTSVYGAADVLKFNSSAGWRLSGAGQRCFDVSRLYCFEM